MRVEPYAVEQLILGKKYHISLNHLKVRLIDRALKRINAGTGVSTNAQSILYELARIMHNMARLTKDFNTTEAIGIINNVLDMDTIFTILPLVIDEDVTEKDIEHWFLTPEEDGDRFAPFKIAMWLAEAAISSNVVVLIDKKAKAMDPQNPLVLIRTLRGVATDADREYIAGLLEKTSKKAKAPASQTGGE